MKKLLLILLASATLTAPAQRNKAPKMAPLLSAGYYVNPRGDTVRGIVQTNPENETDFYKQLSFAAQKNKKPRVLNTQRAKAYGFDGREFIMITYNGEKLFVERLVSGRLKFYEQKYEGKKDGYPSIESAYFIKDTQAEGEDAELKELKKISNKFYKKNLRPYMKDQPMIWSDLDKYTFDEQNVVKAVKEFNALYVTAGN